MCATPSSAYGTPAELPATLQWIDAEAPCTAAAALRAAGVWSLASAPRRFDAEDWWFRTRFAPPADNGGEFVLGFDGLATLAEVWLDGASLLTSDNMFLAHRRVITAVREQHELIICCRSLDRALAARRPRPRWKAPMVENQQLRWFRTTLLGRTPGWSPQAAAVGPWRDVWLERRSRFSRNDIRVTATLLGDRGTIAVAGNFPDDGVDDVTLVVRHGTQRWTAPLTRSGDSFHGSIGIESPQLWWPHTHGHPALYQVALESTSPTDALQLGAAGFRNIELRSEHDDFELRINGERIFCRGACWTPLDVVRLDGTADACRAALEQVRDAGMNMLRISGTLTYENDRFLELCDSLGILLWQDLMFANLDYPDEDAAFTASAEAEIHQQLARLAAHPALAVICGNSEVEQQAAMWGAPRERWSPRLFHEIAPRIAEATCPGVPYWPSSAHGGSFPHQPNAGTTSYYGVGAYLRPLEDARRSEVRFATECLAFANVPEDSCIASMPGGLALKVHHPQWKAATPRDLGAGWDFEDVRDFYVEYLFGVNARQLRYSDHDRYLQLGRVATAETMAAAFGEWRRRRSTCNGALIWFLKDLCPGAGWGIVDAQQQPKAAYYYLRRALQPVSLALSDEGVNGICVHAVNERPAAVTGTLELARYQDGAVLVGKTTQPITVPARGALEIAALAGSDTFADLSHAYRFGPPAHDTVVATLRVGEQELAQAWYFPVGLPSALALDVGLSATARTQADGTALLTVATRRFAQNVTVAAEHFAAEDQYFHLAPDSTRTVRLRPQRAGAALRGTVHALNSRAVAKIEIVT